MINRDTQLCMSLAGRPGNFGTRFHNYLYEKLGLNFIYKAFTTQDIEAAVKGVRALGIRGCGGMGKVAVYEALSTTSSPTS